MKVLCVSGNSWLYMQNHLTVRDSRTTLGHKIKGRGCLILKKLQGYFAEKNPTLEARKATVNLFLLY